MSSKPTVLFVFLSLLSSVDFVLLQGLGSGSDGNLRLCIVEGRGSYKRGTKYCPILDEEKAPVECVIGADRLDCLRRISKGSVDFGVFSPEDLVAAQWANVDVLVTNQLKLRDRPFAGSIVAVVNRRILPSYMAGVNAVLRNTTLCQPAVDVDDIRPLSETLSRYLESQVTARQCDPNLSLTENRIKATAEFFGPSCKAGPWLPDKTRDAELKKAYPSLCAACATGCSTADPYWGDSGALNCLSAGVGDVAWTELDDAIRYFQNSATGDKFSFLCRDGSWQPLVDNTQPCVWLHRPWPVIVAKTKTSPAVVELTSSLTNATVTVDIHWHGALAALLEAHQELPEPLQPPQPPLDYLATATGFREAYSQHGCNPPRHVTLCTTNLLEQNKCEWLGEAGSVHGVIPPLQCARRQDMRACLDAVREGAVDAVVGNSDWMVEAIRNHSLTPILHEATPILEKTSTVFAYTRKDSAITKMADLRGKKAAFPRFDGFAWNAVLRYLSRKEQTNCKEIVDGYFREICAPGVEKYDVPKPVKAELTKNCYQDGGNVLEGEIQALRSVVEGKSDVAFISMNTYQMYRDHQIQEAWASEPIQLSTVCPEDNQKYCFLGWSNIGHVFTLKNLTDIRHHEIVNVFTKLDQLFGKNHVHKLMFSMYGPFNHKLDVLFHNNTRVLLTNEMYNQRPYNDIPFSFERSLKDIAMCKFNDYMKGSSAKIVTVKILLVTLVISLLFM